MIYQICTDVAMIHPNLMHISKTIESLGDSYKMCSNIWFLDSDKDVIQEIKKLNTYLSETDRITVLKISETSKLAGYMPEDFWIWFYQKRNKNNETTE